MIQSLLHGNRRLNSSVEYPVVDPSRAILNSTERSLEQFIYLVENVF